MLWSLVKIVIFLGLVVALTLGAVFLLESDGGIQITLAGTEYTLSALQSVIALCVMFLIAFVLMKLAGFLLALLKFINGDETAISRYFSRNRERKGLQALTEGLVALASGDGKEAMAKAAKADKMLNQPNLGRLITAQAAELAGDRKKAEYSYKKLIAEEQTRFVGIRGIMKQKLEDGDTETALKLAERAFALKPKHVDTQDTLLQLQAQKEDWTGARDTLKAKARQGQLPRDVHKRRDAVLALGQAKGILDEGSDVAAREKAIEANKLSPDLVPAAVLAARGYIAQGSQRNAARVLKKTWSTRPHPDIAAAFAEISPDETPQARLKRFRALVGAKPDHPESKMLLAELHIAAENFPEARRMLGDLVETAPDARVLTIMAAITRGEGGDDAMVKGWLARALSAPRGPQWVCENCKTSHAEWAPVCSSCEGFDTMSWTTPPTPDVSSATGISMLPLIVGTEEKEADDAEVVDVEAETVVETEEKAAS